MILLFLEKQFEYTNAVKVVYIVSRDEISALGDRYDTQIFRNIFHVWGPFLPQ